MATRVAQKNATKLYFYRGLLRDFKKEKIYKN